MAVMSNKKFFFANNLFMYKFNCQRQLRAFFPYSNGRLLAKIATKIYILFKQHGKGNPNNKETLHYELMQKCLSFN